jgi:glutathione S-transferase
MALTLLGRSSSFNVQKVLWLLRELAIPFEHRNLGGIHGGLDTAEFRTLNPHRRVPVLVDGDTIVWESHAILRYLAARYGAERFWSPDPATRSLADRWMDWSQCTLQPAFMALFWGHYRTPPERRDTVAIERARRDCERLFELLDAELAHRPYLGGAAFSLADIPAGTTLYRYFEMGIDPPRPPYVATWCTRLSHRAPYREAVMVPFEELRGRLEF